MAPILVVEDERDIRDTLCEALDEEGLEAAGASSGDCALSLIEKDGFCLIVTDINLPGQLDGISLAQEARQTRPTIPILFISGRIPRLHEARVVQEPVGFLAKPFTLDVFMQRVRALMSH